MLNNLDDEEELKSPEFYQKELKRQLTDYLNHMKEVGGQINVSNANRSPAVMENLESPEVYEKQLDDMLLKQAREDVERRKKIYEI